MAILKIYSISTDIDAGTVNSSKLHEEIKISNTINGFAGISTFQGNLKVIGDTLIDESGLDTIVQTHTPISLDEKKVQKCDAIDARTDAIIGEGFLFDGKQFSLSTEAQTNWLGMLVLQSVLTWPFGITSQDEHTYLLTQENLPLFVGTGMLVIKNAVDSGRALKSAAVDATTPEELDAVVDTR